LASSLQDYVVCYQVVNHGSRAAQIQKEDSRKVESQAKRGAVVALVNAQELVTGYILILSGSVGYRREFGTAK